MYFTQDQCEFQTALPIIMSDVSSVIFMWLFLYRLCMCIYPWTFLVLWCPLEGWRSPDLIVIDKMSYLQLQWTEWLSKNEWLSTNRPNSGWAPIHFWNVKCVANALVIIEISSPLSANGSIIDFCFSFNRFIAWLIPSWLDVHLDKLDTWCTYSISIWL